MSNKLLLLLAGLLMIADLAIAQPRVVERSFEVEVDDKITLNLKFGDTILVKGWDENRVSFSASVEINGGALNDALLLDFYEKDGLTVSADFDEQLIRQGRRQDCPDSRYAGMSWNRGQGDGHVICSTIHYEISMPRNAELEIESISSDIEILNLEGTIHAKTISGFVDLSWPEGSGAELSMKTISGEVYSGLDNLILRNRKGGAPLVGYELRGSIGRGGPSIKLESISGNIYLRKGG